jgi:hypothetical protein
MELDLIPAGTRITEKMDGAAFDVRASHTRTFLLALAISDQIEQESIDASIWGSPDGENWGAMPLLKIPQRFYRGVTRQVLDLTLKPEIQFIRATMEVSRWGRVAPTPMFVAGLRAVEVPAFPLPTPVTKEAAAV